MKFFTSDLRRNLIKILCLTVGLAVGFLLVAKVYFEETFDTWIPDNDRLYRVSESVTMNEEYNEYPQTPGAIAPGLKRYAPQVEKATRYTLCLYDTKIKFDDDRMFNVDAVYLADTAFFDIFKTRILGEDPHDALAVKKRCYIPKSLADKIGGNVIGQEISTPDFIADYKITIAGIYEDFPLNSSISNDIYLSLPTIGDLSYDGTENWMGNDRYISFALLAKGAKPEDLQTNITKMLQENIDREALEMSHFNILLKKLVGTHASEGSTRTMTLILSVLAIVMLMSAGLNYILIVLGQMGHRSKEMAIRKCYGTSNLKIFGRILGESLFFLTISVGLAILLAWCFSDQCRRLLGYTPEQLFSTGNVWIVEGVVCLVLLVITGAVPAWMYCRTPVASAFRTNVKSRKKWKLVLLAIQFFASGMLICILMLVARQYDKLSSTDMGYDYENIGLISLKGVKQDQRRALVSEIKRLSCVEGVASSDQEYSANCSGNNVWLNDNLENQVNVSDMYDSNPEIVDVLGLKIIQGENFGEETDSIRQEVLVEKRFIDVLKKLGVDKDKIVGQTFHITEHGLSEFTIRGVVEDMHRGGFMEDSHDKRAAVIFPSKSIKSRLYIRFNTLTPETLKQVQDILTATVPTREIYVTSFREGIYAQLEPVRNFGTAVIIIALAIIMIALIGLIGYTSDEVQRRAKEIAIRKVTGYPASRIVRLFCIDILRVALPSLIAGGAVAMIVGRRWLTQFSDQVSLSPLTMIVCLLLLLVLLLSVVALNSLSVARSNPVDHLRNE